VCLCARARVRVVVRSPPFRAVSYSTQPSPRLAAHQVIERKGEEGGFHKVAEFDHPYPVCECMRACIVEAEDLIDGDWGAE